MKTSLETTKNCLDIKLVPATAENRELIHKIHDSAYHDVVVEQFGPWDQKLQDDFFEDSWSRPETQVIALGNTLCGYFCVVEQLEGPFVYELVIGPEFQGMGIGSLLLKQLQQKAGAQNKPVNLEVLHKNLRAKALYEKLGFIVTSQSETHFQMRWQSSIDS